MKPKQAKWQRVSVAAVCETIIDCVNKTAPTVDTPTPYKMIRTTNVKKGWVNLSEVKYVTKEVFDRWTRRQLPLKGDVILTREAPLGEVGLLRSDDQVFLGQRLVSYRADPNKLDNRFLLYAFQGQDVQAQIKALGSGATVEHMRVPDCEKLTILLPSLATQRRIASILAAYDDLIENNCRRMAIYEEIVRRVYEEWFVHFRFPGHENVPLVETEMDAIPQGWSLSSVNQCVTIQRGKSYKGSELVKEGGVPFVNLKCIERDGGFRKSGLKRFLGTFKETQKVSSGDLVMAVTDMTQERRIVARCGRVPRLGSDFGVISMDLVKLEANKGVPKDFLYGMFRWSGFAEEVKEHANGANVLHLLPERISDYRFPLPPVALMHQFADLVGRICSQSDILAAKVDILRTTRDLLLPKLISGELDVSTLSEPEEALAA